MAGNGLPKYWREAATLILVAPFRKPAVTERGGRSCNFGVLMLKRGRDSSFLPNAYAYPGGVISRADCDVGGWSRVFARVPGFASFASLRDAFRIPGSRPPMMMTTRTQWDPGESSTLAPEIAYRICAIRETFEETGLLLVCSVTELELGGPVERWRGRVPPMAADVVTSSSADEMEWRTRVSNDAGQFQELCLKCDVVPNIWALYEWNNWLTPVFSPVTKPPDKPKRFDTMFFVCSLDEIPEMSKLVIEEIAEAKWKSPVEWFELARNRSITFVGPQIKETSILASFTDVKDFFKHVCKRELLGCHRWMPVPCRCTDGIIITLPGDELYPENPDYEGTKEVLKLDVSVKTACLQARKLHRFILGTTQFYINVDMPCGYITDIYARRTFPKDFSFNKL